MEYVIEEVPDSEPPKFRFVRTTEHMDIDTLEDRKFGILIDSWDSDDYGYGWNLFVTVNGVRYQVDKPSCMSCFKKKFPKSWKRRLGKDQYFHKCSSCEDTYNKKYGYGKYESK